MVEQLYLISTLTLGLFAGSLLTEAMILVPYWRRMEPAEFFRLHESLGPSLFRYFAPITAAPVILSVTTAMVTEANSIPWLVSAGLCLIALGIFFIYFRAANNRFVARDLLDSELRVELRRWSNWHWVRTILVVVAFGASIYGHTLSRSI